MQRTDKYMLARMHEKKWIKILGIAITPVLFHILVTSYYFILKDPEALEDLFVYLYGTYVYYGPVFLTGAIAQLIFINKVAMPHSWVRFILAATSGAFFTLLVLVLAHFLLVYAAWPAWLFGAFVGGGVGCWNLSIKIAMPNSWVRFILATTSGSFFALLVLVLVHFIYNVPFTAWPNFAFVGGGLGCLNILINTENAYPNATFRQ